MTTYLLPWMVKFTIQGSKYEVSKVRRDSKLVIIMPHLAANTCTFTQAKELPRTLVNPSKNGVYLIEFALLKKAKGSKLFYELTPLK